MRSLTKSLVWAFATLLLASCGGGGGGSSGSGFTQAPLSVTVQVASNSSTPNSLVGVVVRATSNNQPLPEGTQVTLRVSPPGLGLLSAVQLNGSSTNVAEVVTNTLSGGAANFRLHTRALGSVTLTASVTDPAAPDRVVTGAASVNIAAGAPNDPRVTLQATATSLPVNGSLFGPFVGSPYLSEVTITQRSLDGGLIAGTTQCNVASTPVQNGAFSTLDDPETDDINEFTVLLGSGPVDVTAGRGTIFVSSFDRPGPITITVVCTDPQTNENVSSVLTINVGNGTVQLPGSVIIDTNSLPVYVQGVNGRTNLPVEVFVLDGGGAPVPDPATGVNNVRLEIIGGAQGGERLGAVSASGANQQGASVVARTANGVANAVYTSGTRSGVLTLRATSDRADNNVDNGIQDPVTSTRQITVSDGRLFEIEIAGGPLQGATNNETTFNDQTGIYTTVVSAVTTDQNSQPPAPGTVIRWGLIDEPQSGGTFEIAGSNGDAQENGTLFTAVGGRFDLAQPGDTLVITADREQDAGTPDNRDLEGARRIAQIQSSTSLTVTERFNNNENSQGVSVNNGPVLDYVIGHPADANIVGARRVVTTNPNTGQQSVQYVSTGSAEATTDEFGRVYGLITYSRTALGKPIILWAQGNGDLVNGTPEQIADVERTQLQGAGPTTITVFPAAIFPNRNETIQVCVEDAEGFPLPGQTLTYSFSNPGGGEIVSPASTGGVIGQPTGANGCVTVVVRANSAGAGGTLVFAVLGDPEATGTVTINDAGAAVITASPNPRPLQANQGVTITADVQLCLLTETGGVQNQLVQIISCTAPNPIPPGSAVANPGPPVQFVTPEFLPFNGNPTGPDGCSNVGVQYVNLPNNFTATCTYSVGGSGTVTVTYQTPPP